MSRLGELTNHSNGQPKTLARAKATNEPSANKLVYGNNSIRLAA